MNGNDLSSSIAFAVSGLRGSGRTGVYTQLESAISSDPRLSRHRFAFLGNPFEGLPHPLEWDGDQFTSSISRLLACWARFNEFTEKKWIPAVQKGLIPIMDGCGLDAVLFALARSKCAKTDKSALMWHHSLVKDRIKGQGITPPFYLLTKVQVDTLVTYLTSTISRLDAETARAFIQREQEILRLYFEDGNGQNPPFYLANEASGGPVESALNYIIMRTNNRSAAVA